MNNTKNVKNIKETFFPGTIIKCLSMDDKQAVPSGTLGVVTHVDDMGTIHMAWATGSTMGLIVGVDSFEVITDSMNLVESDIEAKRYRFARVKVCELLISSLLSKILNKCLPVKLVFEDDVSWWGISTTSPILISDVQSLIDYASENETERKSFLPELPEEPDTYTKSLGKELLEKIIRKNINELRRIFPVHGQGLLFEFERRE